jgi:hypothetical protein
LRKNLGTMGDEDLEQIILRGSQGDLSPPHCWPHTRVSHL